MTSSGDGWDWFEFGSASPDDAGAEADVELARAFASCFRGSQGLRVLRHLRAITLERVHGPETPDTFLRYVEGQRQLVAYICTLVERANRWPSPTGTSPGAEKHENEVEQP